MSSDDSLSVAQCQSDQFDSISLTTTASSSSVNFLSAVHEFTIERIIRLSKTKIHRIINFTIQRVHGDSRQAWFYHFYVVLKEYEEKQMFVPPFNLLLWPIRCFMRKKSDNNKRTNTLVDNNHYNIARIRRQQQRIAEKYWKDKQISENRSINQRSYVSRQCRCHGSEIGDTESTLL
ncbi:unnamed protein product [Rotaria sp. Silwood2]|nr:unnamed protein product [Rotaria sp. Silwood2]